MSGLFRKRELLPQAELAQRYDVIVIGGGVHGLATAYELAASQDIRNVAVLERDYIGSGGSGRNTQVIRANYNTPETIPFYKASLALYQTLSQRLDFNILFSNQGELDLVHTEDSLRVERDKVLLNKELGVDTQLLTPDEVLKVCPHVDLDGGGNFPVLGASYHSPGSTARHDSVVWAYAIAGAREGVRILQDTEVTGIAAENGRVTGVQTNRGPVGTGAVVSVVAGYSSVVARMAGVRLPIVTHPLQAFVTEPYKPVLNGLVSSMDLYIYVSQTQRGELLAGAEILPYTTYSTRATFDFAADAAARCIRILPFMANAKLMRQWAGLCDMTPDSSPIMGATEVDGFYVSAGWGTWGFKATPIAGKSIAELIATGHTPDLIKPFSVERFREDRMVADAASAGTH